MKLLAMASLGKHNWCDDRYIANMTDSLQLLDGKTYDLSAGDSWVVPKNAEHTYKILEEFTAVEATHPPAETRARDAPPN